MKALRLCATLLVATLLAACVDLAPKYQRPAAPVADEFPAVPASSGAPTPDAAQISWTEFYRDPQLAGLIGYALETNRDLRSTALAIESARAAFIVQRSALAPNLNAEVTGIKQRTSDGNGARVTTEQYVAQGVISAFELDFFGRVRNLRKQALESYLASLEAVRAARITLVSEVAISYFILAADQQRLRLAQRTYDSQSASFELTRRTFELGSASGLDVAQARTSVETARADIATFRTQVEQDVNALTLLVGRPLQASTIANAYTSLERDVNGEFAYSAFAVNLPSDLLYRRPDVIAAEHSLKGEHANVGAARAAYFPSIALTTSLGTTSGDLQGLFESGTRTWTFEPSVVLPIFNFGAIRAQSRSAEVARQTAVAEYERTIQVAFREVADALAQRRDIDELLAAREALVQVTQRSYDLSEARFRRGVDSYLTVLDAQRSLYSAQQDLITVRLLQATNLATLYSVLGGGWQE